MWHTEKRGILGTGTTRKKGSKVRSWQKGVFTEAHIPVLDIYERPRGT